MRVQNTYTRNGEYSVNTDKKRVWFATGNLQYRASDGSWRFAEHQYDIIGDGIGNSTRGEARATQSDWIDLLGYGCTGIENGQAAYTACATDTKPQDYYNGDTSRTSSDFSYVYNATHVGLFRTLTKDEWNYLVFGRSGERFAKAVVHGVPGLVLIPDNRASGLNQVNNTATSYTQNVINDDWDGVFEQKGFVFLPCGGYRDGLKVCQIGSGMTSGFYMAAEQYSKQRSYVLQFKTGATNGGVSVAHNPKNRGVSVRLVMDVGIKF